MDIKEKIKVLKSEAYDMLVSLNQLQQMLAQRNQEIARLEKELKDGEKVQGRELPEHNRQEETIEK